MLNDKPIETHTVNFKKTKRKLIQKGDVLSGHVLTPPPTLIERTNHCTTQIPFHARPHFFSATPLQLAFVPITIRLLGVVLCRYHQLRERLVLIALIMAGVITFPCIFLSGKKRTNIFLQRRAR